MDDPRSRTRVSGASRRPGREFFGTLTPRALKVAILSAALLGLALYAAQPLPAALPLDLAQRFEVTGRGTLTIEGLGALPGRFDLVLVVQPDGSAVVPSLRARIRDFDVVRRGVFRERRTPFRCAEAVNVGPLAGHLAPSGELVLGAGQEVYALAYSARDDRHGCPGQGGVYSVRATGDAPAVGLHLPAEDAFSLSGTFVTTHDGDTYDVHLELTGSYVNRPPVARMGFEGDGLPLASSKWACPPYVPLTFSTGRATFTCNYVQANDPQGLRATLISHSGDPDGDWHRSGLGLEQWSAFAWSFEDGTETHAHLGRGRTVGPVLFAMNERHTVQLTVRDVSGALDRATCEFCVVDSRPPAITAPPPATVPCTVAGGATPGTSRPLRDFLAAAVATDGVDAAPQALTPRVGGTAVTDHTLFPLDEVTQVEFRFQDASENVAVAHSEVRVTDTVAPQLRFELDTERLPATGRFVKVRPRIRATDECGQPRVLLESITSNGPEPPNRLLRGALFGRPVKEFELMAAPVKEGEMLRDRTYVVTYIAVDAAGNQTRVRRKLVVGARP